MALSSPPTHEASFWGLTAIARLAARSLAAALVLCLPLGLAAACAVGLAIALLTAVEDLGTRLRLGPVLLASLVYLATYLAIAAGVAELAYLEAVWKDGDPLRGIRVSWRDVWGYAEWGSALAPVAAMGCYLRSTGWTGHPAQGFAMIALLVVQTAAGAFLVGGELIDPGRALTTAFNLLMLVLGVGMFTLFAFLPALLLGVVDGVIDGAVAALLRELGFRARRHVPVEPGPQLPPPGSASEVA